MVDLENIERIKQLKSKYFRSIDVRDLDTLESIFAEDATVTFTSPTYEYELNGWEELQHFYGEEFSDTQFGLHHGHLPEISVDGDTATGIWYLHDVYLNLDEGTRLEGSAIYEDTFTKQGGEWKIQSMDYTRRLEMTEPLRDDVTIDAQPIS